MHHVFYGKYLMFHVMHVILSSTNLQQGSGLNFKFFAKLLDKPGMVHNASSSL